MGSKKIIIKNSMHTGPRPVYGVFNKDGELLQPGDKIVCFRGEEWVFEACHHPRKICCSKLDGVWQQEFYPSVFDLTIR